MYHFCKFLSSPAQPGKNRRRMNGCRLIFFQQAGLMNRTATKCSVLKTTITMNLKTRDESARSDNWRMVYFRGNMPLMNCDDINSKDHGGVIGRWQNYRSCVQKQRWNFDGEKLVEEINRGEHFTVRRTRSITHHAASVNTFDKSCVLLWSLGQLKAWTSGNVKVSKTEESAV